MRRVFDAARLPNAELILRGICGQQITPIGRLREGDRVLVRQAPFGELRADRAGQRRSSGSEFSAREIVATIPEQGHRRAVLRYPGRRVRGFRPDFAWPACWAEYAATSARSSSPHWSLTSTALSEGTKSSRMRRASCNLSAGTMGLTRDSYRSWIFVTRTPCSPVNYTPQQRFGR